MVTRRFASRLLQNITDLFSLVLPVPGTEFVAAFNYGMSLWGRTAKLICRLPTGGRINYFLKVG